MDKAFAHMQNRGISGMLTDFELLTVTAFLVFEDDGIRCCYSLKQVWEGDSIVRMS